MSLLLHLLDHIQSESLDQLLVAVDNKANPLTTSAIPALDRYFTDAHNHNAPPLQLGDVLQIHGNDISGKPDLLNFMLATCLIPSPPGSSPSHPSPTLQNQTQAQLWGWGRAAVVIDVDGRFSIQRFTQHLLHRLRPLARETQLPLDATLDACLSNLHIFRPATSTQLIATVAHLPEYFHGQPSNVRVGLVALQSVDAFYWLDRFKAEQLQTPTVNVFHHLATRIENARKTLGSLVVMTNWGLTRTYGGEAAVASTSAEGGGGGGPQIIHDIAGLHYFQSRPGLLAQLASVSSTLSALPMTHLLLLNPAEDREDRYEATLYTPTRPDVASFTFAIHDDHGVEMDDIPEVSN